jgi:hypothetical protein
MYTVAAPLHAAIPVSVSEPATQVGLIPSPITRPEGYIKWVVTRAFVVVKFRKAANLVGVPRLRA